MSSTGSTSNDVTTLVIEDPGQGRRLDVKERGRLRTALKEAARGSAPAVLLQVHGDAWAHVLHPDEPTDAEGIGADQHALIRAVHDAPHPVLVHVAGEVSELGVAMLLAADVRILGAEAAVSFAASAPQSLLAAGVSALFRHRGIAAELLWTGATLSAAQAVEEGLAAEVAGTERAQGLTAALSRTPHATSALRRSLRSDTSAGLAERLVYDAWLTVVAAQDSR